MVKSSTDYSKGKIYCIRNYTDDDVYVGSTTQALSKRMANHREDAKGYKKDRKFYSKVNTLGVEQFYIELIEDYPCETLEQLRKREGYYIREIGTLNSSIAGRSKKEWREENIEHCKAKDKEYH